MSTKTAMGAANQSRRRDVAQDGAPDVGIGVSPAASPYQGLELDEENSKLRLVTIEPSGRDDAVVCTLAVVPFEDKPKFEAISYMWGPESSGGDYLHITLNGLQFPVLANLLGALRYLRNEAAQSPKKEPGTRLFWIDAICINQGDIEERNRQVRIMKYIYFRASTVVVWLGHDYSKLQDSIPEFSNLPGGTCSANGARRSISAGKTPATRPDENIAPKPGDSYPAEEVELVLKLQRDPYWSRVWILQEIGQARKLRVCFGRACFPWVDFMNLLVLHNSDGDRRGPLWLDRMLRQERYTGSHTLMRLLRDHEMAFCSEPRDKVYGLVGLASDAADFPIDYKKPLTAIWKDTMVFLNEHSLFAGEWEIVATGQLLKKLLMSGQLNPLGQVMGEADEGQAAESRIIEDINDARVFTLKAALLGGVVCVGPSAVDIVAKPRELEAWEAVVQRQFRGPENGAAHQESDTLQDAVLELSRYQLKSMCFNRPSTVVWEEFPTRYKYAPNRSWVDWSREAREASGHSGANQPAALLPLNFSGRSDAHDAVDPRLILIKERPGTARQTRHKMGIASSLVRTGDLVCWVRSSRRALLVRLDPVNGRLEIKVQILGTALATEDVVQPPPELKRDLGEYGTFDIHVDAMTIFTLLE